MTLSNAPLSLLDLLTVGNVVTAGVYIYRANWKTYFNIAFTAILWLLVPILALVPIILVLTSGAPPVLWGLLLLWFAVMLYCFARYLTESALIARLAFGYLINQSESINAARRYLQGKLWRFFWATVLVGILTFIVFAGLYIVAGIVLFALLAGLGIPSIGGFTGGSPAATGLFFAVALLGGLAVLLLVGLGTFWFTVRMSIADIPLAIEPGLGASTSIGRSWSLTAGNVGRLMLILTVAFLITIPVLVLTQVGTTLVQQGLGQVVDNASPSYIALSTILGYALGLVSNVLLLPVWQSIRAVIYYDLRSRREGYGLTLSDRPSLHPPTDFAP